MIHTVPEQHTGEVRNQGIAETSHIGHCTQTAGSGDVKVQNIMQGGNNITRSTDCKHRTAATVCSTLTRFVSVHNCKYRA